MGHKIHKHMNGGKSSSPLNQNIRPGYRDPENLGLTDEDYEAELEARALLAEERGLDQVRGTSSRLIDRRTGKAVGPIPGNEGDRVDYLHSIDSEALQGIDPEIYGIGRDMLRDSINLVNQGRGGTAKVMFGGNLGRNLREASSPESYEAKLRTAIRRGGKVEPGESGAPSVDIIAPKSYGPGSYTNWNFRDQVDAPNIGKDDREKLLNKYIKSKLFNK